MARRQRRHAVRKRTLHPALRNVGVYFGVANPLPEDVAAHPGEPPEGPSLRDQLAFALVVATVLALLLTWRRSLDVGLLLGALTIVGIVASEAVRWSSRDERRTPPVIAEFAAAFLFQLPLLTAIHAVLDRDEPLLASAAFGVFVGACFAGHAAWAEHSERKKAREAPRLPDQPSAEGGD